MGEQAEARNAKVLAAAVIQAQGPCGWSNMTRESVAAQASVSAGSVSNAFGTMDNLRDEVMREAVRKGLPEIIAQGLAAGSQIARNAPPALKTKALATLQ